ncbi:hypothetical protein ACFFRL_11935 [Agromyces hippuratus]|uniref:hypothetical protein n=1 Tax=Agromyces hippuratus TaxID=286438 RepID=UPI0035E53CCB
MARTSVGLVGGFVSLGLLAGCSMFELNLSSDAEVETTENLRISAEEIRYSDGYCGVGVQIENVSTTVIEFSPNDLSVFNGADSIEWDLPFGGPAGTVTTEYRGYAVGEFPTTLEPGATATDAFVVYCKEEREFTIKVASFAGDGATFEFPD